MSGGLCWRQFTGEGEVAGCVDGGGEVVAMESGKEADERGSFGWVERVAVGRHVSSTLQNLADDLVFGHARSDGVQCWAPETALAADGVAVAALLILENDGAFAFERSSTVKICSRNGIACP